MSPASDPFQAVALVRMVAGLGLALASLELLLSSARPGRDDVWPDAGSPGAWRALMLLRGAAGLTLASAGSPVAWSAAAAVACVASLTIHLRLRFGLEGSDQLLMLLAGGLALAGAAPSDARVARAFLWFVTLQAVGAYATGGIAKLMMRPWRDGSLLAAILRTRFYGHPAVARLVAPGPRARATAWSVMLLETAFPAALIAGPLPAAIACCGALVFHLASAAAMGLNLFVWAFVATYPAVIFCARELHATLGGQ